MPFSHPELKDWLAERYRDLKPATTVDIGPGCGTYSDLMRPLYSGEWKAVEAWAPYIPRYGLWQKYDHVIVADIRHLDLFSVHHSPDLVIIGDCIEHLDRDEAIHTIRRLQAWADNLFISIPQGDSPQEDHEGNWFEIHRASWTHEQMAEAIGPGIKDQARGDVLSAFWWSAL